MARWADGCSSRSVKFVQVETYVGVANMVGQHGIIARQFRAPIRYEAVAACSEGLEAKALEPRRPSTCRASACGLAGGGWAKLESLARSMLWAWRAGLRLYDSSRSGHRLHQLRKQYSKYPSRPPQKNEQPGDSSLPTVMPDRPQKVEARPVQLRATLVSSTVTAKAHDPGLTGPWSGLSVPGRSWRRHAGTVASLARSKTDCEVKP